MATPAGLVARPAVPGGEPGVGRERRVVGLVSSAHFVSHFYPLLLPPLFPLLREVYGVGYTALGFALTVASLSSALLQAPVGFVVDRYGARGMLLAAVLLQTLALALVGLVPHYGALLALMAVSGLANSVFHPADYVILNASVDGRRIGRAFSFHTAAGVAGDALGPVCVLLLSGWLGWRYGLLACAVPGLMVAALLWWRASDLRAKVTAGTAVHDNGGGLALLLSAPVVTGLLFFTGLALMTRGVHGFSVSALDSGYGVGIEQAGVVLAAYLFASPVGVLIGGWLADRTTHHDRVVVVSLSLVAALMFVTAALMPPLPVVATLFAIAGLLAGLVSPSRDMLIRSVTPSGQMGKVFGFVATGFNIGGMLGPPLYGHLLDNNSPQAVFWLVGVFALLTVPCVLWTRRMARRG